MSVNSDLLSAASLALGALAVVYGLWSPELSSLKGLAKAQHLNDRGPAIKSLRAGLKGKALPLMIATGGVLLVLTPPAIATFVGSVAHVRDTGMSAFLDYDPVAALFLAVWCLTAGLAVVSAKTWKELHDRLAEFEQK